MNESHISNDGKEINTFKNYNTNNNGLINPVTKDPRRNRTVKNQNTKKTDADNAAHQNGQECTTVWQNQPNVVNAKEGDITRRCADH